MSSSVILAASEWGDTLAIPYTNFKTRILGECQDLDTEKIFNDKKIIVFSLPGAFTPTCSSTHLPGYEAKYDELLKYVDEVYCVSVNDAFVMNAWAKDLNIEKIKMIPDGSGVFTEGMKMLINKDHLGFGMRSWRYSMLVDNKKVVKQFIEEGKNDSGDDQDPFKVSDADTMLKYLQEAK